MRLESFELDTQPPEKPVFYLNVPVAADYQVNKITGGIINVNAKHLHDEAGMSQYIEQMAKHAKYKH